MKKILRNKIEIILVEPSQPGNIGASARAMKNMGFSHLGLVKPQANHLDSESYKFAWNSHEILENAKIYPDISTAIQNKGFVVAMSTRKGKWRGYFEPLDEYVREIHKMTLKTKVAILFGCEAWGLTNEDLLHANRIVTIRTAGEYTSFNLSQAVLLTCYQLFHSEPYPKDLAPKPAEASEVEKCFNHFDEVLKILGYHEKGDGNLKDNILQTSKKIAGRAVLEQREINMIRGLCSQIQKFAQIINDKK